MDDNTRLKIEALAQIANGGSDDEFTVEKMQKRGKARSQKVLDKYKDVNLLEEQRRITNETYDATHEGMTDEERELAAEREYHKKRKEMGLE